MLPSLLVSRIGSHLPHPVSRVFLPNLIRSTFVLSSCLWSISTLCTSDHADSVKAAWCLHQLRSGNTCIAPTQCPTSVFSHTTLCLRASVWQAYTKVNLKQIPLWAIIMADAFKCLFAFSLKPTMWNNYYLYHLRGENTDPALLDNVCLNWEWNPAFWHQVQYFFHCVTNVSNIYTPALSSFLEVKFILDLWSSYLIYCLSLSLSLVL